MRMRLCRHHTEVPVEARGAGVSLGNFDGVHRGHQAVIGAAARLARELDTTLAVLTFEPHPREFFFPGQPSLDRKRVVQGKSVSVRVDLVGRRIIKKKRKSTYI